MQRLRRAIFKPKQIMIMDADSKKPARSWSVRPVILALLPVSLILAGILIDHYYLPKKSSSQMLAQYIQLQHKLEQLHDQLAASEANNEVKEAKIISLKDVIKQQQKRLDASNQRLHVFESILEARKSQGIKLLQATVKPSNAGDLAFNLTLVKGGNYPRRVRGTIRFITQNQAGENIPLLFQGQQSSLPFHMETHIFLQGQLHWPEHIAKPEHIPPVIAVVSDTTGKQLIQKTCTMGE